MAQKKTKFEWRFLLLLPIPLLWALCGLPAYRGLIDHRMFARWGVPENAATVRLNTAVISNLEYFRFLENRLLDLRFRYRGELDSPARIIYVDMDSLSVSELGNMPWPRSHFAEVGDALVKAGQVKAIGIDVVFSESGKTATTDLNRWNQGNTALAQFLIRNPRVVVAASYVASKFRDPTTGEVSERNFPLLRDGVATGADFQFEPELPQFPIVRAGVSKPVLWRAQQIGLIDTHERGTRWVPLFAQLPSLRYEHMALRLALLHWGLRVDAVRMEPDRIGLVKTDGEQVAAVPLVDRQLMEINWFSRWESEKDAHLAFSRVMAHAQALTSDDADERRVGQKYFEQFKDAIVLIGPVDPLLQDLAPTPLDDVAVPRVGVYGNALKTILSGQYLVRVPHWGYFGIVFGLTFLATGLAIAGGARGLLAKCIAVVAIGGYAYICFYLFAQSHIVLPMTAPLGAALSTSFAGVIWQLIVEEKQKGRIKNMFGTYLSPELVSRMVESAEDPKLGGHEEVITAYFSDIQSFSSFSEMLPPDRLVELMNEYLTACTDLVQEEGGTLDKYIGDAVVAIYGAPIALPDHAFRACVATQRVQLRIAELRDKWKGESGQWPEVVHNLRARIGLNTGPAIIGNMGSRSRFSYTMMGDNVNLAARMESGAKSWGAYTMCTEATKAACEQHGGDRVVFRPLGRIVVMGRSQPVPVYEITGLREHLTTQTFDCLGLFAQGLEKYYARDWDGAIKAFQQSARTEPLVPGRAAGVKSNPSLVYLDICQHFKQEPPPESWDGVYVMKEK